MSILDDKLAALGTAPDRVRGGPSAVRQVVSAPCLAMVECRRSAKSRRLVLNPRSTQTSDWLFPISTTTALAIIELLNL
jgi:hypothetical protein